MFFDAALWLKTFNDVSISLMIVAFLDCQGGEGWGEFRNFWFRL